MRGEGAAMGFAPPFLSMGYLQNCSFKRCLAGAVCGRLHSQHFRDT